MSKKFVLHATILIEIERPDGISEAAWPKYAETLMMQELERIMDKQGIYED